MVMSVLGRTLFDQDYIEIKRLAWEGASQAELVKQFKVTQSHISKILRGHHAADVPWPDRSTGGLTDAKRIELQQHKQLRRLAVINTSTKYEVPPDPISGNDWAFDKDGNIKDGGLYKSNGKARAGLLPAYTEGHKEVEGVMVAINQWGDTKEEQDAWNMQNWGHNDGWEASQAAKAEEAEPLSEVKRMTLEEVKAIQAEQLKGLLNKDYNPDEDPILHPELKVEPMPRLSPIPWTAVMAQEPDNAFVKEADASDDTAYKAALGELLRHVAASNWTTKLVEHNRALAARWLDSLPSKD